MYLDSADIREIRRFSRWGIIDGVTTTPTFFRKLGITDARAAIRDICREFSGEVHVEALGRNADEIVAAARDNRDLGENVVSKIPIGDAALEATCRLAEEGLRVNLHLVFTLNQAMLAARSGAAFVCPLLGRMADSGIDGVAVLEEIVSSLAKYPDIATRVMASSIRNRELARGAILAGAAAMTASPAVLLQMLQSTLTDRALNVLVQDAHASSLVAERMRPLGDLPVVSPTTPLLEALASMTTKRIGTAAVVVDERVVGVVTDGDVRRALSGQAEARRTVVEVVMTAAPKMVEPEDTVERALALITEHRISELIVVGPMRRPVGLLSLHDIMTVPEAS